MKQGSDKAAATGIMHKMNQYIDARNRQLKNSDLHPKYNQRSVEDLIRCYKDASLPQRDRAYCLESIYLKVFFFFPYFLGKRNYRLSPTLYDETLQNISLCILDAIARFDPDRGKLFLSYAYGDIMAAISKTFRDLNVVQVPSNGKERGYLREDAIEESEIEPEEDDEVLEVDRFVEQPEYGLATVVDRKEPGRDISADRVLSSRSSSYVETDRPSVVEYEENLHTKELVDWLEEALSSEACVLTDDERMVLVLHNGLFGNRPHVYTDIARMRSKMGKGASRSRISQIHTKAVKKVRQWFKEMGISEDG